MHGHYAMLSTKRIGRPHSQEERRTPDFVFMCMHEKRHAVLEPHALYGGGVDIREGSACRDRPLRRESP